MHFKNGREVKIGDRVVGRDYTNNPVAGVVVTTSPGATTCNIGVIPLPPGIPIYTAGEFLHVDDALPVPVTPK